MLSGDNNNPGCDEGRPRAKVGHDMATELENLRARAQWYRSFAELGTPDERVWRKQMADYFDRLAAAVEKRENESKSSL
jgi:hypothetical protein